VKRLDSDALDRLYRTLGIQGGSPSGETDLDDGNVSLVLSINDVARRSRTPAATTGWYACVLQNVHAAGGLIDNTIDPYNPGTALAIPPFPANVPRGFDFWVLGVTLQRSSGAGDPDAAMLFIDPVASQQGWGRTNAGALISNHEPIPIARFDALDAGLAGTNAIGINSLTGEAFQKARTRVPRGANLFFRSDASAAATFRLNIICGLFAEGLGQDIAP